MKLTIRFIRVKNGDCVDFGNIGLFGVSGTSKYLGFKPGRAGRAEGWIVVAQNSRDPLKKKRTHQKT
jgi:hypothetical protein